MRPALAALAAVLLLSCSAKPHPAAAAQRSTAGGPASGGAVNAPAFFAGPPDGKLHLYFLDVGQGDATLVVSPSGTTVLIDGGPARSASHLVHRLPELLRDVPDWIVLTDPRPEHLGGLAQAVDAFGARRFLDPGLPSPSPEYQQLLRAVEAHAILRVHPTPPGAAPLRFDLGGGATLEVLWPRAPVDPLLSSGDAAADANALVMRVSYGQTSALLASDILAATEGALLQKELPLHATLLKVADHASARASSPGFLAAVAPRAAIVTAGPGPREGLPSPDTLARLEAVHARIFRTDLDGEVHAVSDGNAFTLTTERPAAGEAVGTAHVFTDAAPPDAALPDVASARAEPAEPLPAPPPARAVRGAAPSAPALLGKDVRFVASRHSRVFHLPSCRSARRIKPDNLITFRTRAEAMRRFKPASDCHP